MWYGALWSAHGSWCGDALLHHSDRSDSNNPQTPFARAAVGCVLLLELRHEIRVVVVKAQPSSSSLNAAWDTRSARRLKFFIDLPIATSHCWALAIRRSLRRGDYPRDRPTLSPAARSHRAGAGRWPTLPNKSGSHEALTPAVLSHTVLQVG